MNDLHTEALLEFKADHERGKAEILAEEKRLRDDLDNERYSYPQLRSWTRQCGCKWELVDDWMEGDTITHTKHVWTLCDEHEAMGVEP